MAGAAKRVAAKPALLAGGNPQIAKPIARRTNVSGRCERLQ
jgi:hypothetical protein